VTSVVYEVPPPALGLVLTLDCGERTGSSSTTLHAVPDHPVVGTPVTLTATVGGSDPAPTGTVSFTASDASISDCQDQPLEGGQATCTVTFPHATSTPVRVTATYSGDGAHPGSADHLELTIDRATPMLTWAPPADISYPTPLGPAQLNATANVPGSFSYTVHDGGAPAPGAVLHAGADQLLDVTFTPTNTADYTTVTAQVPLTVQRGAQAITTDPVPPVAPGTPSVTVTAHGGGSGLPVAFASQTPATCAVGAVSGTSTTTATIAILATGTCTLLATQDGTADWAPASPVTVSFIIAPQIALTASRSAVGAYRTVILTGKATQDVRTSGSAIQIVDRTDNNRVVRRCEQGRSCKAQVFNPPGQHDYVAQLVSRADSSVKATSAVVSVIWKAPTVRLTASTRTPAAGRPVILTATSSQNITFTPYHLDITDVTAHRLVARCFTGSTCRISVVGTGSHTYQATLLTPQGVPIQEGVAPTVTVRWPL
jgi:Bacterial Ig-like domain (group 3)